jgi:demethylspheroidene O-methyltransferase
MAGPGPSWLDRLQSSPGFRSWARAFPLTRPIARRRAAALFDLCAGFVYAQVLFACVRLDLFETLAAGPREPRWLAARWGLPVAAAERLLAAAEALRLVARRGERFGLGPLGAAMVGNAGVAAMIEHHAMLYADLADPVALLRAGRGDALSRYWGYATAARPEALSGADVAPYSALMAASQPLVAAEILDAYRIARHRVLLDVGGGEGAFLIEAARRAPRLRVRLFDLPEVAARGRVRLAALGDRADATGGDMFADPLPRGADVISLVRVLHDHDDAAVMTLWRAARAALPPGGRLLVAEPMAGTRGAERMGDAYFGFYLLAMGQGRPRRAADLARMLAAAGFSRVRVHSTRTPLITGLISCVNLT